MNVEITRKLNLCLSCEICNAVCPNNAITMEFQLGQFLPKVDKEKCTNCGLCLRICPGIDIDPEGLHNRKFSEDMFNGSCIESYIAYSKDISIRKNSGSGGLITHLVIELIKNKEFDYAFVLNFKKFEGEPARLNATDNIKEIFEAAKSKYIPSSVYNVIKTLQKRRDKKYIIVGMPCQIHGIKKFLSIADISEDNLFFLGLFCEKTLNFNILKYYEDTYKRHGERLVSFYFKTKEKYGWPGDTKLCFDSGREIIVDKKVRMSLKEFFQLNRCLFCLDKLNKEADISFGDCYIKGKSDFWGMSNIIIRTSKGKQIFEKYSHLFNFEKISVDEIRKTQGLEEKKRNLEYIKLLFPQIENQTPRVPVIRGYENVRKELLRLQKHIRWGAEYRPWRIKTVLLIRRMIEKIKWEIEERKSIIFRILFMIESFLIWLIPKKKKFRRGTVKNVIITGAGFRNKGAQAMLFTVMDEIRRRNPDAEIYLFSTRDYERMKNSRLYRIEVMPWTHESKVLIINPLNKIFIKDKKYGHLLRSIKKLLKSADCFIDISGYSLSSQWPFITSLEYLENLIIAKKFSIPFYIFPQSIGPFGYSFRQKLFLFPLLKLYLKYPEKIFVRETEGLKLVKRFSKNNV
ncbi:MAG TPA: 4Fe-4S dicluster domain-containing protein, partial [Firmicutes bacterium]|nr:4Fe-4S dicluster domain-containing protein [Bacillota bacterium]